jgi:ACT domain
VSYLIRVVLPDRPGSLGALATALGAAHADIISLDVVEHRPDGFAIDDILVELPLGRMADGLVSAAQEVPGVRVQFLRRYAGAGDLHRDLDLVEAMTAQPLRAEEILTDLAPGVFRADWAVLLDADALDRYAVVHASASAPDCVGLRLPWLPLTGTTRLPDTRSWAPSSWRDAALAAAPIGGPSRALLLARSGGPEILDSELARLRHLAGLAETIQLAAASAATA